MKGEADQISEQNSYHQILRASSIIGGAQGLNYLVGMVRVKIVALLLGPAGVGLVSLYSSSISLIGTISGLGISLSGVREVARAHGEKDPEELARTVRIVRRLCWVTGLAGWALAIALAQPVSRWVFDSSDHAIPVAILGATLLFRALTGGETALLQGVRRIGDLARSNVIGMLIATVATLALYGWLRERGIVPVLVATGVVSLVAAWWYSRRVTIEPLALTWRQTLTGARQVAGLGMAVMWSSVLTGVLDMATRSIIVRAQGMDGAGLYQSAWAISGMFAGFILTAMGTDFYPRLTSVIHDHAEAARTVNQQTEIGVLLALPGLLGTLVFAPLVMQVFYSKQFVAGASLLPWFLVGIFGRVVSWPLGYIQLAKGASRWFAATETTFTLLHLGTVALLVPVFGVVGAAYAFAVNYGVYTLAMSWLGWRLIGFRWSHAVQRLLLLSGMLVGAAVAVSVGFSTTYSLAPGGILTLIGVVYSARGLSARLGAEHRVVRALRRLPGGRWLLG